MTTGKIGHNDQQQDTSNDPGDIGVGPVPDVTTRVIVVPEDTDGHVVHIGQ